MTSAKTRGAMPRATKAKAMARLNPLTKANTPASSSGCPAPAATPSGLAGSKSDQCQTNAARDRACAEIRESAAAIKPACKMAAIAIVRVMSASTSAMAP